MTKGMWTDTFFHSDLYGQLLYDREYHGPRELFAPSVQKEDILKTLLNVLVYPNSILIEGDVLFVVIADGYKALFIPFPGDFNKILFEEKI